MDNTDGLAPETISAQALGQIDQATGGVTPAMTRQL